MLISWVSKPVRRYLLLSVVEQHGCRPKPAAAGPLQEFHMVLVENYTRRLWGHLPRNMTQANYDQSLGTPSEGAFLGECVANSDAAASLLSPVYLLDKRIIPVAKGLEPVSIVACISYTSGNKEQ